MNNYVLYREKIYTECVIKAALNGKRCNRAIEYKIVVEYKLYIFSRLKKEKKENFFYEISIIISD